jgi:hypothetical protein
VLDSVIGGDFFFQALVVLPEHVSSGGENLLNVGIDSVLQIEILSLDI